MIPVWQAPETDLTRDASPSVPALLTLWGLGLSLLIPAGGKLLWACLSHLSCCLESTHLPAHIPPDWKGITPSFSSLPAPSAMLSTQQIPFLGTACLKGGPRPARQARDLAAAAYEEQRQCSKAPGRILQEKTHNSPLGCRIKSWDF